MIYSEEDHALLKSEGWEFLNEEYIHIPNDEDGCMAYGEKNIRYIIETIRNRLNRKST